MNTFKLTATVVALTLTLVHFTAPDGITDQANEFRTVQLEQLHRGENVSCGDYWTPYIGSGDETFDETSYETIEPGCNLITTCLTGNNGGISGTASFQIIEVTSSGSQIFKDGGYHSGGWSGCSSQVGAFYVGDFSKLRVVVQNDGLELVFQINAG